MYNDISFLNLEAKRVISLLKKDFLMSNGTFFLEKYESNISNHHIFPDLGDFLPFFLYFGESEFIDKQISIYESTLVDGYLVSEFPSFHISNLVKSYEYSDLLFGLYDYHLNKKDKNSYDLLIRTSDLAIKTFVFDGKVKSFFYLNLRKNLPLFDTRDGTFIEFYIDLYKLTKEERYKKVAFNIYRNLIQTDYYIKHGLFSVFNVGFITKFFFKIIGVNKSEEVIVCKNNSNTLFGMLALYSETKDVEVLLSINRVIDNIKERLINGGVSDTLSDSMDRVSTLTSSFPIIDVLCDLFFETKNNKYLSLAKSIADYWISKQGKTGLFPLKSNKKESFFDSETDMCVALEKLFELTGDTKYKESMELCFKGIIDYHSKNDYVISVDIETGHVVNTAQRTKFIALFLKLLILRIKKNEGVSIYSDKMLWSLLRDR